MRNQLRHTFFQIKELKLEDPWAKRCAPQDYVVQKDEMGRRCGLAPPTHLQQVLKRAAETAKEMISKKRVCINSKVTELVYIIYLYFVS